jgi:plastocyanin
MNRLLASVALVISVAIAAGCSGGASGQSAGRSAGPDALKIAAKDLSFSTNTLSAPANKPFQIAFDNQESPPHNVAIYKDASAAEKLFGSDPFSGPASVVYDVPALRPGTYFFRCDVHPAMSGQLTVR